MQSFTDVWDGIETFLRSGIAGSEFTPLRLLTVITLTSVLVWVTRRVTRWFVDTVLARRGFDIGMREALGAIVRYVIVTLGALVIFQSAGIDLTHYHRSARIVPTAVRVAVVFGGRRHALAAGKGRGRHVGTLRGCSDSPTARPPAGRSGEHPRQAGRGLGGSVGAAGALAPAGTHDPFEVGYSSVRSSSSSVASLACSNAALIVSKSSLVTWAGGSIFSSSTVVFSSSRSVARSSILSSWSVPMVAPDCRCYSRPGPQPVSML